MTRLWDQRRVHGEIGLLRQCAPQIFFPGVHHPLPHLVRVALVVQEGDCLLIVQPVSHVRSELNQMAGGDLCHHFLSFLFLRHYLHPRSDQKIKPR